MTIEQLFQIICLVSAALLIVFVLLHSPKGDGLGSLGGQAQLFTSAKSAEKTLNRITWALGLVFLGTSVILSAGWLTAGTVPSLPEAAPPTTAPVPSSPSPASPQGEPQNAVPPTNPAVPDLPAVPNIPSDLGADE